MYLPVEKAQVSFLYKGEQEKKKFLSQNESYESFEVVNVKHMTVDDESHLNVYHVYRMVRWLIYELQAAFTHCFTNPTREINFYVALIFDSMDIIAIVMSHLGIIRLPYVYWCIWKWNNPGGGGVLNFELGTDVRPEVSTTTL